ncbi:helix-turn-helix domain-containing protein [Winogradskyella psychrotolerans]|uniref:helix-turn-helix domain-containing protein n=1 Tax=Winogradskyella psychrotolerans TaxID=1344585 RepID=UPI001C07DAF8|nr:AraC family transcriptional regulator [Winogradskyella psychrotolerans]MBU2929900.1 AraC family transcriptional regulator [Winogradskyella psychrotolerans]
MGKVINKIDLGDPSNKKQNFIDVNLKLLCCRYWYLGLWDCHDMVYPFWRIYWNKNGGGQLTLQETVYTMESNYLYIISPFTSFSTRYLKNSKFDSGIHVSGKNLSESHNEAYYEKKYLLHFFTHFNLGAPFDNVSPGIFKIELTDHLKERLVYLTERLKIENHDFKLTFNMRLQSFVKEAISNIGPELWKTIIIDDRVLTAHRFIEAHIEEKLSNPELAAIVNMAPNSFARLFKDEMNITLHKFIQNRKIAKACEIFDYTNDTIENIAFKLGFSDRYHFSRVFKSITGISPALYKSGRYTS